MRIGAVLFDFDMTLVDSSYAITECTNVLAHAKGVRNVDRSEVMSVIGLPILDSWRALWGDVVESDWVDFYRINCRDTEEENYRLFDSSIDTVAELRSKGCRVGVVSNRRFAYAAVAATDLRGKMDVVVGIEDVSEPKPSPEPLLHALRKLGIDRSSAIYVGDTDIDMKTAIAANILGIGVTTGNFKRDQLVAAGAWKTVDDLREIPEIIENIETTGE